MSSNTLSKEEKRSMGDQLEKRMGVFGGRITQIVDALAENPTQRHVRDQLLRSGTAPGAHYAEARSAQSNKDFVHKVSLAAKEASEARYWLRVVQHAGSVEMDVSEAIDEVDQLVAILVSSLQTARDGT